MSKNIILILMYHRHKLLDLIDLANLIVSGEEREWRIFSFVEVSSRILFLTSIFEIRIPAMYRTTSYGLPASTSPVRSQLLAVSQGRIHTQYEQETCRDGKGTILARASLSLLLKTRKCVRCNVEVNFVVTVIPHSVTSVYIQSQSGKSNCSSVLCEGLLPLMHKCPNGEGDTLLGSDYNFIIHTRAYNDLLWRLHIYFFVVLIFLLLYCGVEILLEGSHYKALLLAS
jgi:hypothetical protein